MHRIHGFDARAQLGVGKIGKRVVTQRLHQTRYPQSRRRDQRIEGWYGESNIARIQKQIIKPGIAALFVIRDPGIAAQPGGFRHLPPKALRHLHPRCGGFITRRQQAQRILRHVNPGTAMRRIDHEPQATPRRQG